MRVDSGRPRPTRNRGDAPPIAQAAGVIQHVTDGQRRTVVWQLRQVLANGIVERQLAVAREQQHRGGGELLRHRAGLENRRRCISHAVLEVGHPVRALEGIGSLHADAHRASRRRVVPSRHDRVDASVGHHRLPCPDRCRPANRERDDNSESEQCTGAHLILRVPGCQGARVPRCQSAKVPGYQRCQRCQGDLVRQPRLPEHFPELWPR
jgi:hypothetical protein